ncbi:MAG TPA: plasmid maintenance system antidote protein [Mucilaginibacter sp.]|jgi:plasmid maintenance system antidote protein VapI
MPMHISLIKGIHPGVIVERELKKRKLSKSRFALSLQEYPQVLGEITKGKRKMNIPLALKIESALGFEEGYLMMLQLFYDIKQEKQKLKQANRPDMSKFRPIVFWDTKMDNIDWIAQKRAIIKRVLERGNEQEKEEVKRFYGMTTLKHS